MVGLCIICEQGDTGLALSRCSFYLISMASVLKTSKYQLFCTQVLFSSSKAGI